MEACLEPTPQRVAKVATEVGNLLFELVFAEKENTDPNWYKKSLDEQIKDVASQPFWLREVAKENEDLERLKEVETLDGNFMEWLRTSFNNGGKSLIDLH